MKRLIYLLLIIFLFSCNASKPMGHSSVAINMQTSDTISTKSILLKKGTVYYIVSTDYGYIFPSIYDIFKIKSGGLDGSYGGGATFSHSGTITYLADTTLRNQFLVEKALKTAIKESPSDLKPMYNTIKITDPDFIGNAINRYRPDYVISVDALEFHISGYINQSTVHVEPYFTGTGMSPGSSQSSSSGKFSITYRSIWRIKDRINNRDMEIKLTGNIPIKHHNWYDIIEDLINSTALQVGIDFVSLITPTEKSK